MNESDKKMERGEREHNNSLIELALTVFRTVNTHKLKLTCVQTVHSIDALGTYIVENTCQYSFHYSNSRYRAYIVVFTFATLRFEI